MSLDPGGLCGGAQYAEAHSENFLGLSRNDLCRAHGMYGKNFKALRGVTQTITDTGGLFPHGYSTEVAVGAGYHSPGMSQGVGGGRCGCWRSAWHFSM